MRTRLVLSAFFKFRNIASLIALLAIVYFVRPGAIPYWELAGPIASVGIYLVLVMQSLVSKKFHEDFKKKEKVRQIQNLNYMCTRLASEAKKHTNSTYLQKLRKVMEDKSDIVESFFKGEHNYLKEKVVEQTLNLVVSYIKLLINFCKRSKELGGMDLGEITNRINTNLRKLSFVKDPNMADDLKKVIEMDEKIIERLKDEKNDLERISAKLDYMESTVNLFKHQILSSIESEEMVEKLETAVNEATALDSVLEERRRNRIRMR